MSVVRRGVIAGVAAAVLASASTLAVVSSASATAPAVVTGTTLSVSPPPAPDVYIADAAGQVVEEPAGGGPQTTVGSTGVSSPWAVAVDAAGDLYIGDGASNQVVEEPAGGGPQTTIASGLGGASGVAVDPAGDVYVADGDPAVLKVPAGGGAQTTVGTGLRLPWGVAVDAAGDVYISDSVLNEVVEVPAGGGPQTTIASGLNFPTGVALDAAGDVFIADMDNNRVVEVPAGGGPQITVASGLSPTGVAVDAAGDVFISDAGNTRVVELPADGGPQITLWSGLTAPFGVAVDVPAAQASSGEPITLRATVQTSPAGGAPTGSVTFRDGATMLGTATLSTSAPHVATLTTSALAIGTHTLTATYGGDTTDLASAPSAPVALVIHAGLAVATSSLPEGTVGATYSAMLEATGGSAPLTWSWSNGAMPDGLSLDPATGAITGTPERAGTFSFTVGATDSNTAVASANLSITVDKGTPAISASATPSSAGFGDAVTYSATVTGGGAAPGGTVTFSTGSTTLCTAPLTAGGASCQATTTPVGSSSVAATYSGDADYLTATAAAGLTMGTGADTVSGGANPSTAAIGQSVTYSATVTGAAAAPTGTVAFSVGNSTLCTGTVSEGIASCSATNAPAGSDAVTVTYSGDANYAGNTSTTTVVIKPMATVSPSAGPSTATVGQNVTYSAMLSGPAGAPTGTVSFNVGGTRLCSATVSGGSVSCSATNAPAGSDTVTVTYSGDGNYAGGTATTTVVVNPAALTVTAPSFAGATVGEPYWASLPATGGTPSYTWSVSDGSLPAGLDLDAGTGAIDGIPTTAGTSSFTVAVTDAHTQFATTDVSFTVGAGTPSVIPSAAPLGSAYGQSVTYSAAVTGGGDAPTGSLSFSVGSTTVCTATVSAGSASCSAADAPLGADTVVATYSGDANYTTVIASMSIAVAQAATTTMVTVSSFTAVTGQRITYSASVSSSTGTPPGTVTFAAGTTSLCTAALVAGTASCSATAAPKGTDTVTASYAGDVDFAGSSGATALTVDAPSQGYWMVGSDGGVFTYAGAHFYGSMGSAHLQRPVVGMTPTADHGGYWMVGSDGGMFAFGDAGYHGSIPGLGIAPAGSGAKRSLAAPIVAMVASPTGKGYLQVAADGGVFAFGDALFHGSCPGIGGCSGSIVAVVPDAGERGYWVVTSTGHVYAFGNAGSVASGSPGAIAAPITAASASADGQGYLIVDARGDVYGYGDARSLGGSPAEVSVPGSEVVAVVPTSTGTGYWLMGATGAVYPYGDATNQGAIYGHLNASIVTAAGF